MSQPTLEEVLHSGGCHCGAVRFTVRAPSILTCWDCNCSICAMKRNTHFVVPSSKFALQTPAASLTEYRFNTGVACHMFCSTCGVQSFYRPRSNPDGVAVTIHCLDPGTVQEVRVKTFDGQQWEKSYAATGIASCSLEVEGKGVATRFNNS